MARPFTREGIQTRLAIQVEHEAHPDYSLDDLSRKFNAPQKIVDSALGKTTTEWQALLDSTPAYEPKHRPALDNNEHTSPVPSPPTSALVMPGLEQGIVKFTRKPAKMGEDFIFWIPRVYIKNGLVDPNAEYEVYIKKKI